METSDIKFVFIDKAHAPTDTECSATLGKSVLWWKILRDWLTSNFGEIKTEWKYFSASTGWTQVFKQNDRILFYFYPLENSFCILFMYNDRAIFEARRSGLPAAVITAITTAMRVGELRAFFIQVLSQTDVVIIQRLIKIKILT